MIHPILINDKQYSIKSISELNTKEFIELSKIKNCDHVKYIAWQTGETFDKAFFAVTSKAVEQAIGQAPDITKLPLSKQFDYTKIIDTVGQRHQVENSGLEGLDLLVYCLAVSQARSIDVNEVKKLVSNYNEMPFAEILPSGFFFLKNYKAGKKGGQRLLKMRLYLMNMLRRKKPQGFIA